MLVVLVHVQLSTIFNELMHDCLSKIFLLDRKRLIQIFLQIFIFCVQDKLQALCFLWHVLFKIF